MQLNKKQNSLIEDLKKIKLYGMASDLENQFINEDVYSKVTFFNRIEQLINKQITYALNKKYNSLLKRSKIKDYFSFDDLKYNQQEDGITPDEVAFLASNSWATDNIMNVIIQGATGAGKTALSSAMAINLCKAGITVRNYRWCDLVNDIVVRSDDPKALMQLQNHLCKYPVLIIDDFGLQGKVPSVVKSTVYNFIDSRWKKKSTVFTSQLNNEGIVKLIGDGPKGNAIIDRIFNPSKQIILTGASKR